MDHTPLPHVDLVTSADLLALDQISGPCVSVYLPTHSSGEGGQQDSLRLRGLLSTLRGEAETAGLRPAEVDDLLAPLDTLVADRHFWRYQATGLALFCAPGFTASYRLPIDLSEQAVVGEKFRVAQLASLMSGDGTFFVLALSQNNVQLYEATRDRIGVVALDDTPRSMEEALAHEDPERQLQVRSAGGDAMFHGHGGGDEADKAEVERYIRAVMPGIDTLLRGSERRPLVLASVAYYLPIVKAISAHSLILDAMVEGSPDRRPPEELHREAWPLVAPLLAEEAEAQIARYRELAGTGKTSSDADEIVTRAEEGAVDHLFVTAGMHDDPRVDRAVFATMRTGGGLQSVPDSMDGLASPVAALLRY